MEKNTLEIQIWYEIIQRRNQAKLDYIVVDAAALIMPELPRSTLD